MDAPTQHESPAPLAGTNPFWIRVAGAWSSASDVIPETPLDVSATTETEYGCVDWYQYPDKQPGEHKAAR